jgi:hypothetical protein
MVIKQKPCQGNIGISWISSVDRRRRVDATKCGKLPTPVKPRLSGTSFSCHLFPHPPAQPGTFFLLISVNILHNNMLLSTARRKATATRLSALTRQFSSSPRTMAWEVKKLGVIGAGQMVCKCSWCTSCLKVLMATGSRYCSRRCSKDGSTSYISR